MYILEDILYRIILLIRFVKDNERSISNRTISNIHILGIKRKEWGQKLYLKNVKLVSFCAKV